MPIGVFLDSLAVLIGGLCGAKFKHKIPQSINYPLTIIFGISAIVIGLSIAEIKKIKVVNLLPALLIIFPISFLFELIL